MTSFAFVIDVISCVWYLCDEIWGVVKPRCRVEREAYFYSWGGGRTHLPKFKFSAKSPIGLHMILDPQIKKFKTCLNQMRKIYFNQKSVRVQPCTPLSIVLNGLCFQIIRQYVCSQMTVNMYAINGHTSGVLPPGVIKLKWTIPTPLSTHFFHIF